MSYSSLLTAINTALQGTPALTVATDPRDDSLARAGRGNFDGSYLLINESGIQMWPEISTNPSHWRSDFKLEVGTSLKTDAETESATVESRARAVFEALLFSADANLRSHIYQWKQPTLTRLPQSKRMIWTLRFSARWTE